MNLKVGQIVRIHAPENARIHQKPGTILQLTSYGALLETCTASGVYRAVTEEIVLFSSEERKGVLEYTGSICTTCGSANMLRTGPCETCQNCGTNTGCA